MEDLQQALLRHRSSTHMHQWRAASLLLDSHGQSICKSLRHALISLLTNEATSQPYLQKLGLSKSATAAITIALPLSGAFVGPTAGALSDQLRTRWGRRRPMILASAVLTIVFLGLLAWTEQLVRALAGCPQGAKPDQCDDDLKISQASIALAILWTILVSIVVQPVQAGVRALMVDIAPAEEQSRVTAWASRIQGMLAIFSFFASSLNLADLPGLGRLTQFQALTCLNFLTLGSTVLITCLFISERDSRRISLQAQAKQRSVVQVFRQIYQTVWHLPQMTAGVCKAQFSSWFAWFPLLYYTTTFIGELGQWKALFHLYVIDELC
jgi:solute carrier family 45, member 1/2/4